MNKPNFHEFVESLSEVEKAKGLENLKKNMYQQVSDPLFFKFQAEQGSKEAWLAARELVDSMDQRLVDEFGFDQEIVDYFRNNK